MCRLFFIAMQLIALGGKWGVGRFLKVDDEDFELASSRKWFMTKRGYPATGIYTPGAKVWTKVVNYHQFILGKRPGFFVDHIDGDTCNGQRNNLRWVTPSQSVKNTGTKKLYKGVSATSSKLNPWKAEIMTNWDKRHIGSFPTEHLAALAYDFWAVHLHGDFVRTNFKVEKWGP